MGLGQLAATSELTALRAVGLSRRRLGLSVAGSIAVVTALMVVNGETLGPWGQRQADALKASSRSNDLIVARYSGLWAREGNIFLNAQGGEERDDGEDRWLELRDVRLYEFAPTAASSRWRWRVSPSTAPAAGCLRDVTRTYFDQRSVSQTEVGEERWDSQLDATALGADIDRPRYLSATELRAAIAYRERNGLDASEFQEHYWGRWFYPFNVLALCLAAIPFAFGTLRSGGMGTRLFLGIVFSLGFWLLQTQFVAAGRRVQVRLPHRLCVPPVIMLAVSAFLFRRRSG